MMTLWIGYDDLATEGVFVDSDGNMPNMSFWAVGQPDNTRKS